jgi:excinuclease ABC subunit A
MKKCIIIKNAKENNLKNISVQIPLGQLVAIVGKSGSGKSSLIYDILFQASQGKKVQAKIRNLPKRAFALKQKVKQDSKRSLCETNMTLLQKLIKQVQKGDLLIVDEPCAGMAKEDRIIVVNLLRNIVKTGVSVLVIEHQKDVIQAANYVIELGPGAGSYGGKIVFQGLINTFKKAHTPTSDYVFSQKASCVDYHRNPNAKAKFMQKKELTIKGITKNNLKNYTLTLPLGKLDCVTGRIGSGKTSLLTTVHGALFKGKNAWKSRTGFKLINGKTFVRRSYLVEQTSLSSSSTSTPATYLGIWDPIRDLFAQLPQSKKQKLTKSHYSQNTNTGKHTSTTKKVANVMYNGKSIFNILTMTVDQATELFANVPLIVRKLSFLQDVGLGYIELGQPSGSLSGGEAQRVRLAKVLSKKLGDRCIYILDTPSRGLHLSDIPTLLAVFQKIIDKNNTILIADNRDEVICNCDHIISL